MEKTGKEIAIEYLLRAHREGLPQTRGAFFRDSDNGGRSYSALAAIHYYLYITEPIYDLLFLDGNKLPLSYTIEDVRSALGKELFEYIETLNDSESPVYSFAEIAEKIMKEFHGSVNQSDSLTITERMNLN